jgi:PPOX class probable F420-dependent enzyme
MGRMEDKQIVEFLSLGTRTGKLATAGLSGAPHVAPVWFVVDGRELVFQTGRDTVKGRHLQANPRASLCVDDEVFPYGFVIVHGSVVLDEDLTAMLAWSIRIAERYVPGGRAEEYGRRNTAAGELLCRMRMDRVVGAVDIAL